MEREILFCITALQMGLATPELLKNIGKELSEKKIGSIRAELIRRASIPPEKIKTIEQAVDLSASVHNGNYKKILSQKIYRKLVREAFGDSISISHTGELRPSYPRIVDDETMTDIHTVTEESPERYSQIKEIGAGGIGKVLLVYDRHTGRNIAVKELLPDINHQVSSDSVISPDEARFLREARLTAQLEHPSVVPVYEIGRKPDNSIYYTMKYVKGRTLSDIIRSSSSLNERLKFLSHFLNLCNAIAYAHSKGVIHRDIKPHNVMIGEFGETVVLDWGLAKIKGTTDTENEKFANQMRLLMDAAAGKTVAGEVMGTPQYMPPEQAWGDVNNIDEKSDIYSLGAVLYEILTGFPPFDGDSPLEIVKAVRAYSRGEKKLVPVKEEEPESPDELAAIAEKALSADKNRRYQSVVDLIDDVEAYIAGRKVSGHRYSVFAYLRYIFRRGKRSLLFVLTVLTILALATFLLYRTNNIRYENIFRLYTEKALNNIEKNDFLSAAYYAALASDIKMGPNPLTSIQNNQIASSLIGATTIKEKSITSISVSDDSRFLATGTDDGTVFLYELATLKTTGKASFPSAVSKIIFSSEGDKLAAGFSDGNIRIFNLHPFSLVKVIKDFSTPVKSLVFSEGGKYLFAAAGNISSEQRQVADCSIRIYSTGAYKFIDNLTGHTKSVSNLSILDSGKYLISSSYDGNIIVWDIFSKKEIKRFTLGTPVLNLSVAKDFPVFALTEEGKLFSLSISSEPAIISIKSYNHNIITAGAGSIITGGGAYDGEKCRFCDLKIYDLQKNINIVQGFRFRITDIVLTSDTKHIIVSDDRGNIFIFKPASLLSKPFKVQYKYTLADQLAGMRCLKHIQSCFATDRSMNFYTLLPDRVESETAYKLPKAIEHGNFYIVDRDTIIINTPDREVYYANPAKTVYKKIFAEALKIQSLRISNNNEYIGITDTEDTFYLLKKSGGEISDTLIRERNVLGFNFLPDSLSAYFLRAEFNAAGERLYILAQKELMTENPEKILIKTKNQMRELITSENPLVLDAQNTIYTISRNGLVSNYRIQVPYKIERVIHLPKSVYAVLQFEEKNFFAVYNILTKKIVSYLAGHTEPIVNIDVLENRIFTIGLDGTVIVYNTDFETSSQRFSGPEIKSEIQRLKEILKGLNRFFED